MEVADELSARVTKDIVVVVRVFLEQAHVQIVQGATVIPSERPLERMVEQIGGFSRRRVCKLTKKQPESRPWNFLQKLAKRKETAREDPITSKV